MSGSIGGVPCTFVRGTLPAWREESEVWRIPGVDGFGITLLGRGDAETELRAVLFSNNLGVNLWTGQLQALQGQIVAVTNDHGDSYAYCFLTRVGNVAKQAAYMPGTAITTRAELPIQVLML